MPFDPEIPLSDLGEKLLIREFLRPLFDGGHSKAFLGNDCAIVGIPPESDIMVSTDRVPADLIAFEHGIIDYAGLGRYLAVLNLSDLAAAGATPLGLLLNLGMPGSVRFEDLKCFCVAVKATVEQYGGRVLGGDITSSNEFSASATSVGTAPRGTALTRGGARPGDLIFASNPIGVTPAAFTYLLKLGRPMQLHAFQDLLVAPFVKPEPMLGLGKVLRESSGCTSCMDNTDGYSECFHELSMESCVRFAIDYDLVRLPPVVHHVAEHAGVDPYELAFGPGADFGLVGTVRAPGILERLAPHWPALRAIGRVEEGTGVVLQTREKETAIRRLGWNYFTQPGTN
jgi:thiamine-monophosphate kinase